MNNCIHIHGGAFYCHIEIPNSVLVVVGIGRSMYGGKILEVVGNGSAGRFVIDAKHAPTAYTLTSESELDCESVLTAISREVYSFIITSRDRVCTLLRRRYIMEYNRVLFIIPDGQEMFNGKYWGATTKQERSMSGWKFVDFPYDKTDNTIRQLYKSMKDSVDPLVDIRKFQWADAIDASEFEIYDYVVIFHSNLQDEGIADITNKIPKDKIWFVKESYIRGKVEFDRLGYSGWSEFADVEMESNATADEVEDTFAEYQDYINSGVSKVTTSNNVYEGRGGFILIAGQRNDDSVIKLSHFGTYENTMLTALSILDTFDIPIIYKPHPFTLDECRKYPPEEKFNSVLKSMSFKNVNILDDSHSIHDLINKSKCVVTINSGVGFEALLHGKLVFSLGKSDYGAVVRECKSPQDILNIRNDMNDSVDLDDIKEFLQCYDSVKLVDARNVNNIWEKINSYR